MVAKGEFYFYALVQDNCSIVFDIGCREDIHYVEMSAEKEFHLFEPNPKSYVKCKEKLHWINDNAVILNNFGLGNVTAEIDYYEDAESFMKRTVHFQSKSEPIILKVKRFMEYIQENEINRIDFLKIDTEGSEPSILFDGLDFIRENVKYVQFEYASTWLDRKDRVSLVEVQSWFGDKFDFYFLYDEDHPISRDFPSQMTLINSAEMLNLIEFFMRNQYGFNIAMVRKGIEL
jgi:FkbM family methyltransferase